MCVSVCVFACVFVCPSWRAYWTPLSFSCCADAAITRIDQHAFIFPGMCAEPGGLHHRMFAHDGRRHRPPHLLLCAFRHHDSPAVWGRA